MTPVHTAFAAAPMAKGLSYRGRFAPSPTGPLHAGSLVAALASWLDARAHHGVWLVRMEDVDSPRCSPQAAKTVLQQLAQCGLHSDEPVQWQSWRTPLYAQALVQLQSLQTGLVYPCTCSRSAIAQALAAQGLTPERHHMAVYPGTCRPPRPEAAPDAASATITAQTSARPSQLAEPNARAAWRLNTALALAHAQKTTPWAWVDRALGPQVQDLPAEVGDFVLRRADGLWAYQLAVVVDDAAQGITHVVRGQDLADNTPRQMLLQALLGHPTPQYLHTPLVYASDGEKLSKQNGAAPLDLRDPAEALSQAAAVLGLPPAQGDAASRLAHWVGAWGAAVLRA